MPCDLGSSLRGTGDWAYGSKTINKFLGSPILTAFSITLIIILLIMFIYPCKRGTSANLLIKLFTYIFLSTGIVLFLHNSINRYKYEKKYRDNITYDTVDRIMGNDGDIDETHVEVIPTLSRT